MGVYLQLINFDESFKMLKNTPVILNDLKFYSEHDREKLIQQFLTHYSSDVISMLPQCECGALEGEYLLGALCKECNTVVKSSHETDIESMFWLRSPIGVAKLINPTVWDLLRRNFVFKRVKIIEYLTDTLVPEPREPNRVLAVLQAEGVQRGYNHFVENFDFIINLLFNMPEFKNNKKKTLAFLPELLTQYRDAVFSLHVPVPHRSMLIMENVKGAAKMDSSTASSLEALEAFNLMAGIDKKLNEKSLTARMNRTSRALTKISDFYFNFYKDSLSPKIGVFRRHIFSTRCHFSFRAVITSLTGAHQYNEIHVPWGVGIGVLKIHILNRLHRMGYDYNNAIGLIHKAFKEYNPLIDQIMKDLISETPNQRISTLFNRNPTLLMGSIQLLGFTHVKTNLTDQTVSISILLMSLYNGDFDGDEMNGIIPVDIYVEDMWKPFATHRNIHDMDVPYKITRHLTLSKPLVSMVSSWLSCND